MPLSYSEIPKFPSKFMNLQLLIMSETFITVKQALEIQQYTRIQHTTKTVFMKLLNPGFSFEITIDHCRFSMIQMK
jgi:hypothetical protein